MLSVQHMESSGPGAWIFVTGLDNWTGPETHQGALTLTGFGPKVIMSILEPKKGDPNKL